MLTRVARPFGAPSSGFPVGSEPWTAARFGVYEDFSDVIPSFGKDTQRDFLYSFQPF